MILARSDLDRDGLVRRGRRLAWFTIGWNTIEGAVGVLSGLTAGSIALVGFGADSYVEVAAGVIIAWRLAQERRGAEHSERAEQRAVRLIAVTFALLAVGVAGESIRKLAGGQHPDASPAGIVITAVSLLVMPLLARAKRDVGHRLDSRSVVADAGQTDLCVWLSGIVLVGIALNAAVGWWWADPVAALGVAALAGREAIEHWRSDDLDDCC